MNDHAQTGTASDENLEAAQAAAAQGRVGEALRRYSALVSGRHASVAHKAIGDLLAQRKNDDQAAASYARAIELNPGFAEAHNNLANVLWRKSKDAKAIHHYERA